MNRATTRVAPTVLCRDVKRDTFELNVAFYNGDFFTGQAVELIDHLINKFIGTLNAGDQGIEFVAAACKFAFQRFLEISV